MKQEFKKISDFSNKPIPVNVDLFLLEDGLTGIYYNVTKTQLTSVLGLTTPFELQSTISGPTLTLAHTPIARQGYYLNGQRCSIGVDKIILSIVGTLITFKPDEDFTGMDFTETYDY